MQKMLRYFLILGFVSLASFINAQDNWIILQNATGQTMYVALGVNSTFIDVVNSPRTAIGHNKTFQKLVSLQDNIKFVISYSLNTYSGAQVIVYEIDKSFLNPKTQSAVLRVNLQGTNYTLTPLSSLNAVSYPNNITNAEIHQTVVTK